MPNQLDDAPPQPTHHTPKQTNTSNYITQDDINNVTKQKHSRLLKHSTSTPCNITSHALYQFMGAHLQSYTINAFTPTKYNTHQPVFTLDAPLEHICNGVVHPVTKETITKYKKLANDPLLQTVWTKAMCKELRRLAQGWDGSNGTDTIFFMSHDEIKKIPRDRTVTYARIVVDYHPQKDDPNQVRITVGGNLINYPGELTTRMADLTTAKLHWNSTICTPGA